ncbi:hypothetical protein CPB84DRAFT_849620 [Gymnopilus junonius]|uniref:Uncharacterized protein n=1 Tax=Gymnopilus junonius TaxID=109634 RepID=A0A9P5NMU7_GYMJU|nr:hypothetical protein CPB84DRAFT_849620 [Gymnopilus junonius]
MQELAILVASFPPKTSEAFSAVNLDNANVEIGSESVSYDGPKSGVRTLLLTPPSSPPQISPNAKPRADFEIIDNDQTVSPLRNLRPLDLRIHEDVRLQDHRTTRHHFRVGSRSAFPKSSTDLQLHELTFTARQEAIPATDHFRNLLGLQSVDAYIQRGLQSKGPFEDTRSEEHLELQTDPMRNLENSLRQLTLTDCAVVNAQSQEPLDLYGDMGRQPPVSIFGDTDNSQGGHTFCSAPQILQEDVLEGPASELKHEQHGTGGANRMEITLSEETAIASLSDLLAGLHLDNIVPVGGAFETPPSTPMSIAPFLAAGNSITATTPLSLNTCTHMAAMDVSPKVDESVVGKVITDYLADGPPFQVDEFTCLVPILASSECFFRPSSASPSLSRRGVTLCKEVPLSTPISPDDLNEHAMAADDPMLSPSLPSILRDTRVKEEAISNSRFGVSQINDCPVVDKEPVQDVQREDSDEEDVLPRTKDIMIQTVTTQDNAVQHLPRKAKLRESVKAEEKISCRYWRG